MTQILACLTPDVVVMAADRRLTKLHTDRTVEVADEEAAKMVLLGRQVAFGYTGLANVRPPPRGQTDLWLMNALSPPAPMLDETIEQVRAAATEAFSKITHVGPRAKRHAFVAAGWMPVSGQAHRPFYATVSNALSGAGLFLDTSRPVFTTRVQALGEKVPFRLDAVGQPLDPAAKQRVRSDLQSRPIAHRVTSRR